MKEDKGKKIYALFQNLQDQGQPFTYAWNHRILTFEDGKVYLMTEDQIEHLNDRSVVRYDLELSPDGQMKSVPAAKQYRFSVRPVSDKELKRIRAEMEAEGAAAPA